MRKQVAAHINPDLPHGFYILCVRPEDGGTDSLRAMSGMTRDIAIYCMVTIENFVEL